MWDEKVHARMSAQTNKSTRSRLRLSNHKGARNLVTCRVIDSNRSLGDIEMGEGQSRGSNLVDTTDSLEAVAVFRSWKNVFFLIVLICLVIVQGAFWLVETRFVKVSDSPVNDPNTIVTGAEGGQTADTKSSYPSSSLLNLKFEYLSKVVKVVNGALLVTATLYCLAMLFSLQVSLIGRLGGMNHISRAFFLSLIMLVLLIPWQKILGHSVVGAVYMPEEMVKWQVKSGGAVMLVFYYLRFCGYWFLVFLLLILSQLRSRRWSKTILRRLEII